MSLFWHMSQGVWAGDGLKKITAMPLGLDFHTKSEKLLVRESQEVRKRTREAQELKKRTTTSRVLFEVPDQVSVADQTRLLKAAQKATKPFRDRYRELLFPVEPRQQC